MHTAIAPTRFPPLLTKKLPKAQKIKQPTKNGYVKNNKTISIHKNKPHTPTPLLSVQQSPEPPILKTSLRHKIGVYKNILKTDSQYRKGLVSMMINQSGDGLLTGGCLFLIASLATLNPMLSILGLGVFTIIEITIAAVSFIQASHRRDNAEEARRAGEVQQSAADRPGRRLCISGFIDACSAAILLVGVVGATFLGAGPAGIFICLAGVKGIQAFNKSYENGAWNCIKYNLGHQETQKQQLVMRSTIGAIEMGIGGLAYGFISLGAYLALWGIGAVFPPALPFIAIGTVFLGGLMTALPKSVFGYRADRSRASGKTS